MTVSPVVSSRFGIWRCAPPRPCEACRDSVFTAEDTALFSARRGALHCPFRSSRQIPSVTADVAQVYSGTTHVDSRVAVFAVDPGCGGTPAPGKVAGTWARGVHRLNDPLPGGRQMTDLPKRIEIHEEGPREGF